MTVNLDRGSNDLEEIIDRLQKQKEYYLVLMAKLNPIQIVSRDLKENL